MVNIKPLSDVTSTSSSLDLGIDFNIFILSAHVL